MHTQPKNIPITITPTEAFSLLAQGNKRFINNLKAHRNLLQQVNETAAQQFPFATILSCIDSRTSAELIFDQGLGDLFSIRIAGNVLNDDILGSMEFATKVAGTKIVVVLGHTNCAAIIGACNTIKIGHFTQLVEKIEPAIARETETEQHRNGENSDFVKNVTQIHVDHTIEQIREKSAIIADLEKEEKIKIVGGLYHVETGKVIFSENNV